MKTVLFGLDGATYTVLDHLMAIGVMPNLQRFCAQGVRGRLLSTAMPITPQAWTSLATGRTAGHHGIHDFLRRETGPQGLYWRMNDSRDNHCETIWKAASRQGRRVTVLNYIGTSPPEAIQGHSIPGFVSGRHLRRGSYPTDLFERLEKVDGFDVKLLGLDLDLERQALQDMPPESWIPWINHHIQRERVWFGILDYLMVNEPSDLTAIVLDGVDKIQHLAYRFLDPALIPANPTPWESEIIARCRDYFAQVDEFLGRVWARAGNWARVFIASDHGFTATTEVVYINKWLQEQGYLHWRVAPEEDALNAVFSERLADLGNAIDLERTTAYALTPSCNGIYINVDPEKYQAFRAELMGRLRQLKNAAGEPVISEIRMREEWFPGPLSHRVPDLTLVLRDFGLISVLNAKTVVVPRQEPAGTHHPDGIILGAGPGLKQHAEVERLSIIDMAPLLVHSLGLPIPADYEGSFPASLYDADYLRSDPPRYVEQATAADVTAVPAEPAVTASVAAPPEDDDETLLQRLRSLGYVE